MTARLYFGFCGLRRPPRADIEALFGRGFDFDAPHTSLSHSGGYVAVLVTDDESPCGADIELRRPLRRNVQAKFPPKDRQGDFFTAWTRKEAAAKLLMRRGTRIGLSDFLKIDTADGGGIYFTSLELSGCAASAATKSPATLEIIKATR